LQKSANILIVDDCVEFASSTATLLSSVGHHVATSLDAKSCAELVKSEQFDVIIMDINMYDVDGRELARELESTHDLQNTAIIYASTRRALLNANIVGSEDNYLIKPFTKEQLFGAIDTAMKIGV